MQKGIIFGIIILLVAAGGFLLWRAQTATLPAETGNDEEQTTREVELGGEEAEITDEPDVVVDVAGTNFAFSEKEIRVKAGDIVRINFTNEGSMPHDFVLDEFGARTPVLQTGESASVTFVAEEAGTFEYYCSVGMHRQMGMVGTLIVEETTSVEATLQFGS